MAPSNDKDDEQVPSIGSPPANDFGDSETVKSKPPSPGNNTDAANKRKRNDNEEEKLGKDTPVADTTTTRTTDLPTAGVKEVEMKDAEAIDGSSDEGIKEVEMQDAEVEETDVCDEGKVDVDVNRDDIRSNLNATEVCEQDQTTKQSVGGEGSGQQVVVEVARLLEQVQESDEKAKLEVEVKVKKMDGGDMKKENGEMEETRTETRVG